MKNDCEITLKNNVCLNVGWGRGDVNDTSTGADPENFSRGGPTLTYNCGSAQI